VQAIVWNAKEKSNGVFAQLLGRLSQESCIYQVNLEAAEGDDGWLTRPEFDTIMECFRKGCVLNVESRRKVRQCSLCPISVVVSALQAHGRTTETIAILSTLRKLPRAWQMEIQREEDQASQSH